MNFLIFNSKFLDYQLTTVMYNLLPMSENYDLDVRLNNIQLIIITKLWND